MQRYINMNIKQKNKMFKYVSLRSNVLLENWKNV